MDGRSKSVVIRHRSYGFDGEPKRVLYRVRFEQPHVWSDYDGPPHDFLEMEIFEHWLEPA